MLQRHVFLFVFDIEEHRVTLVESSAARILAAEANRNSDFHETGKGQCLSHAVINRTLTGSHLGALLEELLNFGMDMKRRWKGGQLVGDLAQFFTGEAGVQFELRLVASAFEIGPV